MKTYIIFLTALTLISCEGSSYDREKKGQITEWDDDYLINSIRIDDDGEYHIVAVSPSGQVETISDANVGLSIEMTFGNYSKPVLRVHISDRCCGKGKYTREGLPIVCLPSNYKIETFND